MNKLYGELLESDLATFIGKTLVTTNPGADYLPNWHVYLIAEYLEAAVSGQIKRLIINMPPRSLKSVCVSVAWPAWLLGHDPARRIIAASYAKPLSIKHSLDCRLVIGSPWYRHIFPQTIISRDQNEKHKFITSKRGYRLATSVGGGTTGEGGNFIIIDDPLNPAQAMNRKLRNAANNWFEHTMASRLDDKSKGVIVLVMQRLHEYDLSGYLLEKGGWEHLCLPAVAMRREIYALGGEEFVREVGDILHSKRENAGLIERAKIELGSLAFAAQYQQAPIVEEGWMVRREWFPRYKKAPANITRKVQSWDTAIKAGAKNDASVCLTFAEHEGKSYLLEARIMRSEYPDLKRAFYELAGQWQPQAILIEDKSSGQQLLQDIRRESQFPVVAMKPRNDKVTRFAAVSAMIEAGRLLLPEQASWLADFESEIFSFPAGENDDQVDALTQYLEWLRGAAWGKINIRKI